MGKRRSTRRPVSLLSALPNELRRSILEQNLDGKKELTVNEEVEVEQSVVLGYGKGKEKQKQKR